MHDLPWPCCSEETLCLVCCSESWYMIILHLPVEHAGISGQKSRITLQSKALRSLSQWGCSNQCGFLACFKGRLGSCGVLSSSAPGLQWLKPHGWQAQEHLRPVLSPRISGHLTRAAHGQVSPLTSWKYRPLRASEQRRGSHLELDHHECGRKPPLGHSFLQPGPVKRGSHTQRQGKGGLGFYISLFDE